MAGNRDEYELEMKIADRNIDVPDKYNLDKAHDRIFAQMKETLDILDDSPPPSRKSLQLTPLSLKLIFEL